MSRLTEFDAKELLHPYGVRLPRYQRAGDPLSAAQAARELGPRVVLKALVPAHGRGKRGAVRFADGPGEAEGAARALLAMKVGGYPVTALLVEERLDVADELYLALTFDEALGAPCILASSSGGMDIEEVARLEPQRLLKRALNPFEGLKGYRARSLWAELGFSGATLSRLEASSVSLGKAFFDLEATLIEVNPLVLTQEGEAVAAGVAMAVDDEALPRKPELACRAEPGNDRAWRPLTELERRIAEIDRADPYRGTARYTELEGGDIGFLCGGGGGSLLSFDALLRYGGKPANYSECGGNPPARKVKGIVEGILSKPGVKGLFVCINITNNTQTDEVARGVKAAFEALGIGPQGFPAVVRLAGVGEEEARKIFQGIGIEYYGEEVTMEDAASRMVERMRETYPGYGAKDEGRSR